MTGCTPYLGRWNPGVCFYEGNDFFTALKIGLLIVFIALVMFWLNREVK
jgi:hypothetical protein